MSNIFVGKDQTKTLNNKHQAMNLLSSDQHLSESLPHIVDANSNSPNEDGGYSDLLFTVPTATRGRGRPPKNGMYPVCREKRPEPEPRGRGRPPKRGKRKISLAIVATGKGRGRPKKPSDSSDDECSSNEAAYKLPRNSLLKILKPRKKRGRPKKPRRSDQESEDDERLPIGRPATGAINLNIERTGRGQGRPRQYHEGDTRTANDKRQVENFRTNAVTRQRDRPASVKKPPRVKTGRPRGRPKKGSTLGTAPMVIDNDDEELEKAEGEEEPDRHEKVRKPPRVKSGRPRGRPKKGSTLGTAQMDMPTEVQSNHDEELEEEQSEMHLIKIVKVEEKVQMSDEEYLDLDDED